MSGKYKVSFYTSEGHFLHDVEVIAYNQSDALEFGMLNYDDCCTSSNKLIFEIRIKQS